MPSDQLQHHNQVDGAATERLNDHSVQDDESSTEKPQADSKQAAKQRICCADPKPARPSASNAILGRNSQGREEFLQDMAQLFGTDFSPMQKSDDDLQSRTSITESKPLNVHDQGIQQNQEENGRVCSRELNNFSPDS